jgi:hypothetical protein
LENTFRKNRTWDWKKCETHRIFQFWTNLNKCLKKIESFFGKIGICGRESFPTQKVWSAPRVD